ncbi:hypothetical protein [Bradyrhizobium sp. RDI18]|uniref:hypothetical protein n=1 Tax=Bradyrhizobium sp. RDI18 TaxID=3367400 RepID=UPI003724983A
MPFAARAFRAAALVTNRALQQRAAQQLTGDRQLPDKLLTRLWARLRIIHKNESMLPLQVNAKPSDLAVFATASDSGSRTRPPIFAPESS